VAYQANEADQFYHKYLYDAENRITDVYTSSDSVIWEHDAMYRYLEHGPLARTVLLALILSLNKFDNLSAALVFVYFVRLIYDLYYLHNLWRMNEIQK
jgi:hypothetical protein